VEIENNKDRAESAFRAMQTSSRLTGVTDEDVDVQISDLLCNLQHLADEQAIDFQECLERATRTYDAEVLQARSDEE
jgi:hypothetical protein